MKASDCVCLSLHSESLFASVDLHSCVHVRRVFQITSSLTLQSRNAQPVPGILLSDGICGESS